ncbi:MAG TPA: cupredoxin domain-containing protein [Solirubrobacteraceae bacterium]|nr:cupredoxin domain-containing protein [Solirubrobacteraceae bacterium]
MRHALLAALLGATILAGCGGDDATEPDANTTAPSAAATAPPTDTIDIKEFKFVPETATVKAGQKISVPNADSAPHTLTEQPSSGPPLFDTGNVSGRQTGSFMAPKAGTYEYYCELHAFMKGKLVVVS